MILHFSWSWGYLGPFDILDIKVALHFGALHFLREPLLRDLSISTRTQLICKLANLFSFRLGFLRSRFAEAKKMSNKKTGIWVKIILVISQEFGFDSNLKSVYHFYIFNIPYQTQKKSIFKFHLNWPFCCYTKIFLWFVNAILSRATFLDEKW